MSNAAPYLFFGAVFADGCSVYTFRPNRGDRWAYFTRCKGSTTETTTTHQECTGAGKHQRCHDVNVTTRNQP